MIIVGKPKICPDCGSPLRLYDQVTRKIRSEYGKIEEIKIKRFRCEKCAKTHRELPNYLMPYKQFKTEIIKGFVNSLLNSDDLEYEDFPSEETVKRWIKEFGNIRDEE